ncbi:MAG: hypothetical protein ACW97A_08955 [Candidatus Thorarchaeota archaeon]
MKITIRNDEMRGAFQALSLAAWRLLQNRQKGGAPLLTRERKEVHWTSYGVITQPHHEYNLDEFLKRHMSMIRKFPEFERCIEVLKRDDVVNKHLEKLVGSFTKASRLQTPSILETFLDHLMSELKGFEFKSQPFLNVYQMMENYFYSDKVSVVVFVHLEGFVSDAEELDLGEGWSISRITPNQYNELLTDGLLEDVLRKSHYALLWQLEVPKVIVKNNEKFECPVEFQRYQTTVIEIITALRLFMVGDIGHHRIVQWFIGWKSKGRSVSKSYKKPFWGKPYSLEISKLSDFRTLLDQLRKTALDPPLELALKRLNDAVERQDAFDVMLDYMIAFEALFLFKKEGKKSVLPSRVAALMHTNNVEKGVVKKDMEDAYDLRNSIAHGDTMADTRKVLQDIGRSKRDFTELIGDYLRRSIRGYLSYLSKNLSKKQIIEKLKN